MNLFYLYAMSRFSAV